MSDSAAAISTDNVNNQRFDNVLQNGYQYNIKEKNSYTWFYCRRIAYSTEGDVRPVMFAGYDHANNKSTFQGVNEGDFVLSSRRKVEDTKSSPIIMASVVHIATKKNNKSIVTLQEPRQIGSSFILQTIKNKLTDQEYKDIKDWLSYNSTLDMHVIPESIINPSQYKATITRLAALSNLLNTLGIKHIKPTAHDTMFAPQRAYNNVSSTVVMSENEFKDLKNKNAQFYISDVDGSSEPITDEIKSVDELYKKAINIQWAAVIVAIVPKNEPLSDYLSVKKYAIPVIYE